MATTHHATTHHLGRGKVSQRGLAVAERLGVAVMDAQPGQPRGRPGHDDPVHAVGTGAERAVSYDFRRSRRVIALVNLSMRDRIEKPARITIPLL